MRETKNRVGADVFLETERLVLRRLVPADAALLFELDSETAERDLGVVAGGERFSNPCGSVGVKTGEKDRGLHLRAGNRELVVDSVKLLPARYGDR